MSDSNRYDSFMEAQKLCDDDKADDAYAKISEFLGGDKVELITQEMEILSYIVTGKITASAFGDDKKAACQESIDLLGKIALVKDPYWITAYAGTIYEAFSKMNRCVRDEERQNVWCRLKELFLELLTMARKVWKDKNAPERLDIYVQLSKLIKSYLDVADEDTIKMCQDAAKEAKFMGKGSLGDDDWRDANKAIQDINKNINDAVSEKEKLEDSS